MLVKEFLNQVNGKMDSETLEMLEFGYYENDEKHYELSFNDEEITENTELNILEETPSMWIMLQNKRNNKLA